MALTIQAHIAASGLLENLGVKESLNKINEANNSITPTAIGCFLEKQAILSKREYFLLLGLCWGLLFLGLCLLGLFPLLTI